MDACPVRGESSRLASRGLPPYETTKIQSLLERASFLRYPIESWSNVVSRMNVDLLPEVRPACLLAQADLPYEWFARFFSFHHIIRAVAHMRRFILMCRRRTVESGFLKQSELDAALQVVVKNAQEYYLNNLIYCLRREKPFPSNALTRLCPFLDSDGVVCVSGRLQNSGWSYRRKYPMLIPKESHLSVLIARHWHHYACHARPRLLIALVQRQFWVIGIRLVVHRVIR